MKLKDYLYFNRITQTDFCKTIGITRTMLYRILQGDYDPYLSVADKIVEETGGEVTYKDLVVSKPVAKSKKTQNASSTKKTKKSKN